MMLHKKFIGFISVMVLCSNIVTSGAFWDTVTVQSLQNSPPTVQSVSGETFVNVMIELPLTASDADGDAVLLKLVDTPQLGTASITGNKLQYTPADKTGTDTFTYAAIDTYGNQSEPADITIEISKNKTKMSYADMIQNPAHFAALTLSESEIMTGEKIGTSYFFNPDELVTRSQFIAMTAALADFELKETSQTDFLDDGGLSDWVKPYISAAAANGLISGYQTASGGCEIRGENPITLAEACVMLNNLLGDENTAIETAAIDASYAPAWAQSACAVLTASDILPDGITAENSRSPIDRAIACELLYRTMQLL